MEERLNLFTSLLGLLDILITRVLFICRVIAAVAMGLMVLAILVQVFFRYVLNNALPWPDEAARFMMLWMTGLVAPSAYRWGSFVSIDIIKDRLGQKTGSILNFLILLIGLGVLFTAMVFAQKHISGGWLFNSSSLKIPLELIGLESLRIKLAWMYLSLPVGFILMILVNIELLLKQGHKIIDPNVDYPPPRDQLNFSAE